VTFTVRTPGLEIACEAHRDPRGFPVINTERGRRGLEQNRREICRLLWHEWSPAWRFDDATFDRTAPSFDNRDFLGVVVHSYHHRHGHAPGEARYDLLERQLAGRPPITVPTIVCAKGESAVPTPASGREAAGRD
jgi:hypothetical protein